MGPYRPINQSAWGITNDAIFATSTTNSQEYYGLFEIGNYSDRSTWYRSLLFPRAVRLSINQGINYLGSDSLFGNRLQETSDSSGVTKYMDGCNSRVMNYDPSTGEHIGSCSVSGTIEVLYYEKGYEVIAASSKSIKLQMVRASISHSEPLR